MKKIIALLAAFAAALLFTAGSPVSPVHAAGTPTSCPTVYNDETGETDTVDCTALEFDLDQLDSVNDPNGSGSCSSTVTTKQTTRSLGDSDATLIGRYRMCPSGRYLDSVTYKIDRHGHNCGNEVGSWITDYDFNADQIASYNPPNWNLDCVKGQGVVTKTFGPGLRFLDPGASSSIRCFGMSIKAHWGGVNALYTSSYQTAQICLR